MEYKIRLGEFGCDGNKIDDLNSVISVNLPMIGEGLVWVCVTEGWRQSRYWFKTKGEKHQSSKGKTLVSVDIERVNGIKELVDNLVTESRLNQGLEQLRMDGLNVEKRNVGTFLKWVVGDIIKEELDTIMGNGFEPKELNGPISNLARRWFFNKENEQIGMD